MLGAHVPQRRKVVQHAACGPVVRDAPLREQQQVVEQRKDGRARLVDGRDDGVAAGGELLQRADAWRSDVTEERYLLRCQLKTARLFEAAAQLGAIAAGQDPQPCERFARSVGVAFQLLDDVLDVTGPTERTGKPRGADLLDGTVTLPWILAARKDPSLLQVKLNSLDVDAALELCERIEATGSLEQVRAQARVMTDEARASADLLESPTAEAFHLIATAMVERSA